MTVGTHQLVILLAVEVEAGLTALGIVRADKFEGTDAYLRDTSVQAGLTLFDAGGYIVQIRVFWAPKLGVLHDEALGDGTRLTGLEL